jgi:hypothetical protein
VLAGRSDFDQPTAQGETVEGTAERDTPDQVEDDIRALATGRCMNLCRQLLGTDDQLLRDGVDWRVGMPRACRRRSRGRQGSDDIRLIQAIANDFTERCV